MQMCKCVLQMCAGNGHGLHLMPGDDGGGVIKSKERCVAAV
jgi:hypothetical protein